MARVCARLHGVTGAKCAARARAMDRLLMPRAVTGARSDAQPSPTLLPGKRRATLGRSSPGRNGRAGERVPHPRL